MPADLWGKGRAKLLATSLASLAGRGVQGESLILALIAIMLLTGLLQFLLGISGGGQLIKYIPLRGNLFFGTVDRLFTELMPDLDRPVWVILNLRPVQSLDISGFNLFRQMLKRLSAHGGHLLYADVRKSAVMERNTHKMMDWLGPDDELPKVKTFKSNDAALEYAEDALLEELGYTPAQATQRVDLLTLDCEAIESLAEKRQRKAGWAVLYELGGSLARQRRWSRSELRRLERW